MLLFLVDLINIEIFRISFNFFYSFYFILRSRATSNGSLMAPYEALYGRPRRSSICWAEDDGAWSRHLYRPYLKTTSLISSLLVADMLR